MAHTAAEPRLPERQLSAMRIAGEIAGVRQVMLHHERPALSLLAKARIFERYEHGNRVAVVRTYEVDMPALDARHLEGHVGGWFDGRVGQRRRVCNRRM